MANWISNISAETVATTLAALATLAIFSILYKENPAYRLMEHIFIGAAAGYIVYTTWAQVLRPQWWDRITSGHCYWVFALVAGAMFYFIYSRRHVWISRIIFGTLLGLVSGTAFKGFAGVNIDRIHASFKPLYVHEPGMTSLQVLAASLDNILFVVVLLSVLSYFFFSFEHKTAAIRAPARLGRWVLMFAFGAMFGSTVMARMSLLIGRIHFLLCDWLHIAR